MKEHSVIDILRSKYFIGLFTTLTVSLVLVFSYYSGMKDLKIFPASGDYTFEGYTDKVNQGASDIIQLAVTDSILLFQFKLNEGFFSPYAGFSITPKNEKSINASKYNQISLCLVGENVKRLGIGLYGQLDDKNGQGENLFHSYLPISEDKANYHISINQFKHPDWWEDLHQISDSDNEKPDFSNIFHINIGSAYSPDLDTIKKIEIYSIAFTRDNRQLFIQLFSVYLLLLLLIVGIFYIRIYLKKEVDPVTVKYKPVEYINETSFDDDICLDYINLHFQNNDLTLDIVSDQTGINQRKIAGLINERYKCNFKSYINSIRINEAKRLLVETDLNIGEIAYKVGFNNQSHFNRVFKSENNLSPSEYRENH